ncbi:MAG TPA: hypothetical protein VHR72_06355 [Gemmataceae bacterium]|jgi:hypothetical protein|nr:hypothetical protein [Gemmataceae bacterium]
MDEVTAVEIACRFLEASSIEVAGFSVARYLPESNSWSCVFLNQPAPDGAVDAPGVSIVEVDGTSGEATFFETL